jgi:hypothetical protein
MTTRILVGLLLGWMILGFTFALVWIALHRKG